MLYSSRWPATTTALLSVGKLPPLDHPAGLLAPYRGRLGPLLLLAGQGAAGPLSANAYGMLWRVTEDAPTDVVRDSPGSLSSFAAAAPVRR